MSRADDTGICPEMRREHAEVGIMHREQLRLELRIQRFEKQIPGFRHPTADDEGIRRQGIHQIHDETTQLFCKVQIRLPGNSIPGTGGQLQLVGRAIFCATGDSGGSIAGSGSALSNSSLPQVTPILILVPPKSTAIALLMLMRVLYGFSGNPSRDSINSDCLILQSGASANHSHAIPWAHLSNHMQFLNLAHHFILCHKSVILLVIAFQMR